MKATKNIASVSGRYTVLLLCFASFQAGGLDWGGGIGNWDDDTMWSGGVEPTSLDDTKIFNGVVTVDLVGKAAQVMSLGDPTPLGGSSIAGLEIISGGQLSTQTTHIGSESDLGANLNVVGAGSRWDNSDSVWMGDLGDNATLDIREGGQATARYLSLDITSFATGSITVNGVGSSLTVRDQIDIEDLGNGEATLRIEAGGAVSVLRRRINVDDLAVVTGDGSTLTVNNEINVGAFVAGTGRLQIEDLGQAFSADARLGVSSTSYGVAEVTGVGSAWTISDLMTVGNGGRGRLNVYQGGLVTSGRAMLGNLSNALSTGEGNAYINGENSVWDAGALTVGVDGRAWLYVEEGGTLTSDTYAFIARDAGSQGYVVVDGPGSSWQHGGYLDLGRGGFGDLRIINGGHVLVADDLIVQGDGGTGSLRYELASITDPLLDVLGDASLAGMLEADLADGFALTHGDAFTLIDIGGTQTGTFDNHAEGSTLGVFSGVGLLLTYAGGDGNDVVAHAVQGGDADNNGKIDFTDFVSLSNNYNGPTTGQQWANGDFDGDGDVAFADFVLMSNNWGFDATAPAPAQADTASAVNAGEAKLIVGADGSLSIEGGNVDLNGYSITSASGLLNPDGDNNASPFTFYISNTATDVTAGNLGTFANVNGLLVLDASINPADLSSLDLVFQYGTAAGSITGDVEVVPEPSSLALLGLGGLLLARRRRV